MEFADLTEEYTSRLMSGDSLIAADVLTPAFVTEATANDPATITTAAESMSGTPDAATAGNT